MGSVLQRWHCLCLCPLELQPTGFDGSRTHARQLDDIPLNVDVDCNPTLPNRAAWQCVASLQAHNTLVRALENCTLLGGGAAALSACADGSIVVISRNDQGQWDLESSVQAHRAGVTAMEFAGEMGGGVVLTGSVDTLVKVWRLTEDRSILLALLYPLC